jgi:hypothetical protein
LADAADRLHALTLRLIVVDLTAVTFVCSTCANFLATLHRAHPDAELVLHHPFRLARLIVTGTGSSVVPAEVSRFCVPSVRRGLVRRPGVDNAGLDGTR